MSLSLSSTEVYHFIGKRIRSARVSRGLSQAQLADRVELTRTSITNIEKGRQKLLVHTMFLFSNALNVPVAELLAPTDPVDPYQSAEQAVPISVPASARNWVVSSVVSTAAAR